MPASIVPVFYAGWSELFGNSGSFRISALAWLGFELALRPAQPIDALMTHALQLDKSFHWPKSRHRQKQAHSLFEPTVRSTGG